MRESPEREKVRFASGGAECAGWHYPGTNGACVVMAGGFGVTKEPATDLFARRFRDAEFDVLAFDCRHAGESGGEPGQVVRIRAELADWQAALGRYQPFLDGHERAVDAELSFLRRHLLDHSRVDRPALADPASHGGEAA